jgi:hypothetical protein
MYTGEEKSFKFFKGINFSRENLKERNHLEDLDADVKIQLKGILNNDRKVWTT